MVHLTDTAVLPVWPGGEEVEEEEEGEEEEGEADWILIFPPIVLSLEAMHLLPPSSFIPSSSSPY